jgi:type IV secretion system protein VirB5
VSFFKRDEKDSNARADLGALSIPESEKLGRDVFENNPWVKSKRRYFDIYENLDASIAQWRVAAFVMMVLLTLSVAGNIFLAQSVKVQPYIVQVDKHGYAIPVKMADAVGQVDERVIASQVGLFIFNSRVRVMDREAQMVFTGDAYRSIAAGSPASRRLNDYFKNSPPLASPVPVLVNVDVIIPFTAHTYQAQWTEVAGVAPNASQTSYVGLFTIAVSPPTDFRNLLGNPMGVYITDYNIRQESISMN